MLHPRCSHGVSQPLVDHIHIPNGTFTDVQGDFHYNSQTISIQQSKTGQSAIQRKTHTDQTPTGLLELFRASSPGAAFDSADRFLPPKCLSGTPKELLNEIQRWIDLDQTKICLLHGPAGAGKSAIAQTLSETCSARGQLAVSFFFSRSAPSRSHARWFFTTIALQIAHSMPQMRQAICKAVEDDLQILYKQHSAQLKQLLVLPLLSPSSSSSALSPPFLVIVDGLDECDGDQSKLLLHILELANTPALSLRFLIFSRPEPQISHFFNTLAMSAGTRISIYGDHQAREDVRLFLQTGFNTIHDSERHAAIMKHVPKPWPSNEVIQLLVNRSDGYFIYASTVLKYVDEEYSSCIDRLREILKLSKPGSSAFAELDKLYKQLLVHHLESVQSIQAILGLHPGQVEHILRSLHSVPDSKFMAIASDESSHSMPHLLNFFLTRIEREDTTLISRISMQTLSEARRISFEIMTSGNLPSREPTSLKYDPPLLTILSSAAKVGRIIDGLVDSLKATNPLSEKDLIDYLDESSHACESYILASSGWSEQDRNFSVSMLNDLKICLQVITAYYHCICS